MKREVILELNQQNKVNYESFDEFAGSHFYYVYRDAATMTRKILEENKKYYDETVTGNDARNQEQIYNILSFVGERGSGKTSSMLSYAEFLRDYGRIGNSISKEMEEFKLLDGNKLFTVVDSIEASILADNEEVFEIILARMLAKFMELDKSELFQQGDYEFKRRELYAQFEKLYGRIKFLRTKGNDMTQDSDTPLQKLKELSATYNVKKEFTKLVRDYVELIRYKDFYRKGFEKKDCYIVIPIDDIDMNIKHCYEMLEQIHRFLLIPNVIILLSYESKFIGQVCEMHYLSEFKDMERKQSYKGRLDDVTEPLVRDYLEKMLPNEKRIYMPSLPEEMGNIKIQKNDENVSIKKAIFLGLYRCLGTVFYYDETTNHILEPLTLRDLSNFYMALMNRPIVDFELSHQCDNEKIKEELEKFEENYNWFLKELMGRFAKSSERNRKKMEELINSPYENKVTVAYVQIVGTIKGKEMEGAINYYDLLTKIIEITSNPNATPKEKAFPELITVYFTALFSYIDGHINFIEKLIQLKDDKKDKYMLEREKWEKREKLLKNSKFNMEKNIAKITMCKVYDYDDPVGSSILGYGENLKGAVSQNCRFAYEEKDIKPLCELSEFKTTINRIMKELLFTNYYDLRVEHENVLIVNKDKDNMWNISISPEERVFFDITAPIWNVERYDSIADKFAEEIAVALKSYFEDASTNVEEIKCEIRNILKTGKKDIKLLSVPDILVHMWKKEEKTDIESHKVATNLCQILKEWKTVISSSWNCVEEKSNWENEGMYKEIFGDSCDWRDKYFDRIENKYKIQKGNRESTLSVTGDDV